MDSCSSYNSLWEFETQMENFGFSEAYASSESQARTPLILMRPEDFISKKPISSFELKPPSHFAKSSYNDASMESKLVLLPPSAFTSTRKTTFDHISNIISNFNKNQYEEENWDFDVESYDEFGDHIYHCSTPNYPESESEIDIDIFPEAQSSSGFMDSAFSNLDPNTSPITVTPVTPSYRFEDHEAIICRLSQAKEALIEYAFEQSDSESNTSELPLWYAETPMHPSNPEAYNENQSLPDKRMIDYYDSYDRSQVYYEDDINMSGDAAFIDNIVNYTSCKQQVLESGDFDEEVPVVYGGHESCNCELCLDRCSPPPKRMKLDFEDDQAVCLENNLVEYIDTTTTPVREYLQWLDEEEPKRGDSSFIICQYDRLAHNIHTECELIEVCQILKNEIATTKQHVASGIHFSMPNYPLESAYLHTKLPCIFHSDVDFENMDNEDEGNGVEIKGTQTDDMKKNKARNEMVSKGTQTVEGLRYIGTNIDTFEEEYE